MKERPILFSAPMVRAILEGRKTQTRRVCKDMNRWVQQDCREVRMVDGNPWHALIGAERPMYELARPYGTVGDRLWVRETWAANPKRSFATRPETPEHCVYRADNLPEHVGFMWTPSIHMPRKASRINLEVTGVRVARLQDISEADALAEGLRTFPHKVGNAYAWLDDDRHGYGSATGAYRALWQSINGPGCWLSNPWVWVVEFKRVPQ